MKRIKKICVTVMRRRVVRMDMSPVPQAKPAPAAPGEQPLKPDTPPIAAPLRPKAP